MPSSVNLDFFIASPCPSGQAEKHLISGFQLSRNSGETSTPTPVRIEPLTRALAHQGIDTRLRQLDDKVPL